MNNKNDTSCISVLNGHGGDTVESENGDHPGNYEWDTLPIPMTFRTSLFKHGEQRAIDSMALKANEADLQALDEHADAMAEEAGRNAFDPERNLADKLHVDEYEKNLGQRDELRQKLSEARRQYHAKQQELAELGDLDRSPKDISNITKFILAVLVGATIVLTLHDFVFDFDDEIANWLVSSTTALLLGLGVVWIESQNFD